MKTEALAKVNFTLEVFPKRVDGFHALCSVVVPVSLADSIEIEPDPGITSDTGYPDDLCVKAACALKSFLEERNAVASSNPLGARIHVEKRIPAGGGLGGGSADAAAVLRALNEMWGAGLSPEELAEIGAGVGSDVPALVLAQHYRAPVLMEGRGELVAKLDLARTVEPIPMVMVNPGVFSSTPEVFANCSPRLQKDPLILYNMKTALESGEAVKIASALQNDLDGPACRLHPEISAAKEALAASDAMGVLMSGSGSTVFGLVQSEARGREIAALLSARGLWARSVLACPVV